MYDWLTDALSESSCLLTANRRLARTLSAEYGAVQVAAGKTAWRSPVIDSWHDWLDSIVAGADGQASLPTRINAHQSQWLWERCLRREVGDSVSGIANLVRMSRDTWQRLADWRIPITEVARSVQNHDQRMFATAAGRYLAILQREGWVDDAGLGAVALELVRSGRVRLKKRYTFVGFDRHRPVALSTKEAIEGRGSEVREIAPCDRARASSLQRFQDSNAELRSAGAWARRRINASPDIRIAVVVSSLEQHADKISRLFKEGFAPGWQYGPSAFSEAVNVSYGRQLVDYPAIATALTLLQWLVRDLSAAEIGVLLRTPLLANGDLGGRSRLELQLRQLPDRDWSPSMTTSALRGKGDADDGADWLARVAAVSKRRRDLPQQSSPAEWAVIFDETLSSFAWPGDGTLNSAEFQLINRWRELLNEFAQLDLVAPRLTLRTALSRLETIARETVFQSETKNAVVSLMGPLEASGAEFDAVWISGLTAANWPPTGSPSVLVSRRLQQRHGMPDSTPADTVQYAERLLARLAGCAKDVTFSYAAAEDDAEQIPADFLSRSGLCAAASNDDPGWNASRMVGLAEAISIADEVPKVKAGEKISGGAGTIQRQLAEPISAFVAGRLGVKLLYPQAFGISPLLRGNIIHDAAYSLYTGEPSRTELRAWKNDDLAQRISAAVDHAFVRHERHSDSVLRQLLKLERRRVSGLLRRLVAVDTERCEFQAVAVEHQVTFELDEIRLALRIDRIDRFDDGTLAILDYKTGATKKLMRNKEDVNEIQLFVYAMAVEQPVVSLALVNIDSRDILFDGAGRHYTDEILWPELLQRVQTEITAACRLMAAGDVRINVQQSTKEARALNLLSRFTELRRDG